MNVPLRKYPKRLLLILGVVFFFLRVEVFSTREQLVCEIHLACCPEYILIRAGTVGNYNVYVWVIVGEKQVRRQDFFYFDEFFLVFRCPLPVFIFFSEVRLKEHVNCAY